MTIMADVAVQHGREAELAALEADAHALDPSIATPAMVAANPYIEMASGR